MESYLRYTTVVRHFVQCNNLICYFVHRNIYPHYSCNFPSRRALH